MIPFHGTPYRTLVNATLQCLGLTKASMARGRLRAQRQRLRRAEGMGRVRVSGLGQVIPAGLEKRLGVCWFWLDPVHLACCWSSAVAGDDASPGYVMYMSLHFESCYLGVNRHLLSSIKWHQHQESLFYDILRNRVGTQQLRGVANPLQTPLVKPGLCGSPGKSFAHFLKSQDVIRKY